MMKFILSLLLCVSSFGAVGTWNGTAFSAWNGATNIAWNGIAAISTGGTNSGGGGGGATGLLTSLAEHWKLDESSGNAGGSSGTYTMVNSGSTTFGTGLLNNGSIHVRGSSQFFSVADNSVFSSADESFSCAGWFKTPSDTTFGGSGIAAVFFKGSKFGLYMNGLVPTFQTAGSDLAWVNTGSGANITANTWYFFSVTYTASTKAKTIFLRGASYSGSRSTGTSATATADEAGAFCLGAYNSVTFFWDGQLDEIAFWKGRVLSTGDETLLYNSGTPLAYSSW